MRALAGGQREVRSLRHVESRYWYRLSAPVKAGSMRSPNIRPRILCECSHPRLPSASYSWAACRNDKPPRRGDEDTSVRGRIGACRTTARQVRLDRDAPCQCRIKTRHSGPSAGPQGELADMDGSTATRRNRHRKTGSGTARGRRAAPASDCDGLRQCLFPAAPFCPALRFLAQWSEVQSQRPGRAL